MGPLKVTGVGSRTCEALVFLFLGSQTSSPPLTKRMCALGINIKDSRINYEQLKS